MHLIDLEDNLSRPRERSWTKARHQKTFGGKENNFVSSLRRLMGTSPPNGVEGILFMRYVIVRTASDQRNLGTFICSMRVRVRMSMFALINPILLRGVRVSSLMYNA